MKPLELACGVAFLYQDPDQALDPAYPDIKRIFYHISWSAREGFSGVEFASPSYDHFKRTYQPHAIVEIRRNMATHSMRIAQVECNFMVPLAMKAPRETAREQLERTFEGISGMPCRVVTIASSIIPDVLSYHGLLFPGGPPSRIQIPNGFTWSLAWEKYVETISLIVDTAKNYGLRIALEPRPRETIATTDALLTLFKEVGSNSLGALVDTAYMFTQREYIPLSLRKIENRIFAVHLSDSDGLLEHHWAPGEGKINWAEVIKSFRSTSYDGLFTIDTGIVGNPELDFRQGKSFLERLMLTL
jgi:sugar phosphate isomerase/epimerase